MNTDYTTDDFLADLAKNLADEADAIKGYYKLIKNCPEAYQNFIPQIVEIISDEKNHMEKLQKILLDIDKIKPNKD